MKNRRDPLFYPSPCSLLTLFYSSNSNLLSNNMVTQPYHHIEVIFDYILFWFLSQDLAYSFDICSHL